MMKKMQKSIALVAILAMVALAGQVGVATAATTGNDSVAITVTVQETLSMSCDAAIALGTLNAGTPNSATATCTTTTNSQDGYDLFVKQGTPAALTHTDTTTTIANKTAFDGLATSTSVWSGTGLGFRVMNTGTHADLQDTTMWGVDGTPEYAGFPATDMVIADSTIYASASTAVVVEGRVDVAGTQKSGAYNSNVTFTSTVTP